MLELTIETRRAWVVICCLTLAFFALMWVPCEMIIRMRYAYEGGANNIGGEVAERTRYIWPTLVGFFLAGAFLAHRAGESVRGIVPPLVVLTMLLGAASAASYVIGILSAFLFRYGLHPLFLFIWFWLVYRIGRFLLRRFFSKSLELSGSLFEKAALYSVVTIPQALCQFGLILNPEWYFTFP